MNRDDFIDGILNVNKPQNMTSHDVVAIARRALGIKKIGHTGTLDPMATGVLPLCIGNATRIIEYMDGDKKEYLAEALIGKMTDTLDVWGNITDERYCSPLKESELKEALQSFVGEIVQIPPKYSAIRVNGKRLYQYAREDIDVKIPERKITIFELELMECSETGFTIKVICSKGTYIRSLISDICKKMGRIGIMSRLCRLASGRFVLQNSLDVKMLKVLSKEDILSEILPVDYGLSSMPTIHIDDERAFVNGMRVRISDIESEREAIEAKTPIRVYGGIEDSSQLLGIGKVEQNRSGTYVKGEKVLARR